MANEFRENVAFEPQALFIRQKPLQIRRDLERRHNAFLRSTRCGGLNTEDKPVVRMRTKRDRVKRFLDRREIVLAEGLHETATRET